MSTVPVYNEQLGADTDKDDPVPIKGPRLPDWRQISIYEVRRRNLITLLRERFDNVQLKLCNAVGRDASYISRLLNDPESSRDHKNMGAGMARHCEQRLRLPENWMDQNHELLAQFRAQAGELATDADVISIIGLRDIPVQRVFISHSEKDMSHLHLSVRSALATAHTYALRIADNSLYPHVRQGQYLSLDPQREPVGGDDVYLCLRSTGEWSVRLYVEGNPDRVLLRDVLRPDEEHVIEREDIAVLHTVSSILPASSLNLPVRDRFGSQAQPSLAHEGGGGLG
jgi:hypothetical protein